MLFECTTSQHELFYSAFVDKHYLLIHIRLNGMQFECTFSASPHSLLFCRLHDVLDSNRNTHQTPVITNVYLNKDNRCH